MESYLIAVAIQIGIYALMTLGLNLQYGFTGLINFGLAGFYCLGAYAVALLATRGIDPFACLAVAAVLCSLASWPVGWLTLRLRGDFLAIVTLGFSEVIRLFAVNMTWLTKGSEGYGGILRPYGEVGRHNEWFLLVVLAANVVAFSIFRSMVVSPFGRAIRAIRDDEDAVKTLGKDPLGYRVRVLAVGCALFGLAGGLQAYYIGYVNPDQFTPEVTFLVWIALILGGVGTLWGATFGAIILFGLLEGSRFARDLIPGVSGGPGERALAIVGLALIVVIAYRPGGAFGKRSTDAA
ncbi:MAG: branched-chain amino acid ABC transporter permease [Actinomycetota bacterium]